MSSNQPRLFSTTAMVIGAVLGSLAAAVYMLYANYQALGYPKLAIRVAIGGWLVLLVLLVVVSNVVPAQSVVAMLSVGLLQAGMAYAAGNVLQGPAIDYHSQQGGPMHSNWTAVTVGLLASVVLLVLMVLIGGQPQAQ